MTESADRIAALKELPFFAGLGPRAVRCRGGGRRGRFHRIEQGDFLGEMAVMAGKKRMATVTVREVQDRIDAWIGVW